MTHVTVPIDVFISHEDADVAHREALRKHLSVLKRQDKVRTWHLGRVVAGDEREDKLTAMFESASIIILLVTVEYLASDAKWQEMQRALQRHNAQKARVFPVIIDACDWEQAPFSNLEVLPQNRTHVQAWTNQNEAWASIVHSIRLSIDGKMPRVLTRVPIECPSEDWRAVIENPAYFVPPPFSPVLEPTIRMGEERKPTGYPAVRPPVSVINEHGQTDVIDEHTRHRTAFLPQPSDPWLEQRQTSQAGEAQVHVAHAVETTRVTFRADIDLNDGNPSKAISNAPLEDKEDVGPVAEQRFPARVNELFTTIANFTLLVLVTLAGGLLFAAIVAGLYDLFRYVEP